MLKRSLLLLALTAGPLSARNVVFVDNARAGGLGTADRPFATLAEAMAASGEGGIIYVADGNVPYEGGVTLRRGQMLIGSAFGLDAARVEFHIDGDMPPMPAVQGPGPTIHGAVWLNGDNIVAGCTIVVETATAISSSAPDLPVTLRNVWIRPSKFAGGIALQAPGAVTIRDGGLIGATSGTGLAISGGSGDVIVENFPTSGSFGTAIGISGRQRGKVVFQKKSPVKISDAAYDAIIVSDCPAPVVFADALSVVAHGARGLLAVRSKLIISGEHSAIETTNGSALEVRDSDLDVRLESISASGKLVNGVFIDKARGKFEVTGLNDKPGSGGSIQNAQAYGIRIAQSSGIRLAHMNVMDSGSADAVCADGIERETNVRCRAAIYLRHVSGSVFEDLAVRGGSGVGLNANNINDVRFSAIQIAGAGSTPQEPALLLQETGAVTFNFCRIAEGGGGAAVIEQRFSRAKITFTRSEFSAAQGRTAPWLLEARAGGSSTLDLQFESGQIRGSAGGAIRLQAAQTSRVRLRLRDSYVSGAGADHSAIVVTTQNSSASCVDLSGNTIVTGFDTPAIWLVSNSGVRSPVDWRSPAVVGAACGQ